MHTVKVDKERLAAERFDERGLALAVALKKEIGDAASVIYCCNLRDAAVEILDTFHLKEWPRDTDFRKRALDAAVH